MNRSESITNLAAALAKAQATMTAATKDSDNPHFKSKYADLSSVWDACRPALTSNGLSVVQLPAVTDTTVTVETCLLHETGEFITGSISIPVAKPDAQGIGSAVTYARRYSLAAIVGIAPAEDDDGEAAVGRTTAKSATRTANTPPPKAQPPDDPKAVDYYERIRGALRTLYGEDKETALDRVEELSTWIDKDGVVKAAGVRDYRNLRGKRLEILTHKLEDLVRKGQIVNPPPAEPDVPVCEFCDEPLASNGVCINELCIPF